MSHLPDDLALNTFRVGRSPDQWELPATGSEACSRSHGNDSLRADSGQSRGDPFFGPLVRPMEASKAAIRNGCFTSTPAACCAQIPAVPRRAADGKAAWRRATVMVHKSQKNSHRDNLRSYLSNQYSASDQVAG